MLDCFDFGRQVGQIFLRKNVIIQFADAHKKSVVVLCFRFIWDQINTLTRRKAATT